MISIIISTSNRAESLAQTLQAIGRAGAPDGVACELIVVDNGSTDHTAEVVRSTDLGRIAVRCLREERRGKSYALNTALAASRGEILLFTDDDVRPMEGWIGGMIGPILSDETDCVAGGVKIAPHLDRPWMTQEMRGLVAETVNWTPEQRRRPTLTGANMAFSRSVLARVPAFDTDLGPGALGLFEDTLFGEQLKEAGFRVQCALDVVVEHHFDPSRLTRPGVLRGAEQYGRCLGYAQHHWNHQPSSHARIYLLKSRVRLRLLQALRPADAQRDEGASAWEWECVHRIGLYGHTLSIRNDPRHYSRRGLVRL